MLGTTKKRRLATKASESGYLMHFCVDFLQGHPGLLGRRHEAFHEAGLALQTYLEALDSTSSSISPDNHEKAFRSMLRHLTLCPDCGIKFTPKHHLWVRLTSRTSWFVGPGSRD